MPLLAGKKNIGHNIEVEQEAGKPHKQAVAIALSKARGGDDLAPVGAYDPERAVALKKHAAGLTRSQDIRRTSDTSPEERIRGNIAHAKNLREQWHFTNAKLVYEDAANQARQAKLPALERLALAGVLYCEGFAGKPDVDKDAKKRGMDAAEPVTGFEKNGGTGTRDCEHCKYMAKNSGCDQPTMIRHSGQPKNKEGLPVVHEHDVCAFFDRAGKASGMRASDGVRCQCESSAGCGHVDGPCGNTATRDVPTIYGGYKMCRKCAEALPNDFKKGNEMRATDIQGHEIREKLGISEAEWAKLDKSARQDKAREALRKAKDEVMPVGDDEDRRGPATEKYTPQARPSNWAKLTPKERADWKQSKDTELPTAVKTSSFVPMPSGEHNEVSYAPRRIAARDRGRFKKVGDSSEVTLKLPVRYTVVGSQKEETALVPVECSVYGEGKVGGVAIPKTSLVAKITGKNVGATWAPSYADAQREYDKISKKSKATDSIAKLPLQTSGSEPADHMLRANQYEIAGDRARALDSYRAAASGYRRANDRANEAKARDGVAACQTKFAQQYDHPGRGRAKVCDSADAAMRTAVERTRAGESVLVNGKTVKPRKGA